MRHITTVVLLAGVLALAGCSGSEGGDKPTPTATVTKAATPSLSAAEAEQACVDAWFGVMTADGYDPDVEPPAPVVCGGLPGQADMYLKALQRRNAENRGRVDECLADPSCTSLPIP